MTRLPIGVRLTLWYVAIFATAQVVFGGLMFVTLRHHLYEIVDDRLQDQSEDLQNFLLAQKSDATVAKMQEVEHRFGCPLIELWGMTEIAGIDPADGQQHIH